MRRFLLFSLVALLGLPAPLSQATIVTSEVIIVDPTADLQAAVDATPVGGTLRLGHGIYTVPDGGLLLTHSIVIEGCGNMGVGDSTGTVLSPFAANADSQPVIMISPAGTEWASESGFTQMSVILRGLTISGGTTSFNSGSYGILCDLAALSILRSFKVEDCTIMHCGDDGIHAHGLDGAGSAIVGMFLDNVRLFGNFGHGVYVKNVTVFKADNSMFFWNHKFGALAYTSGVTFENCSFELNGRTVVDTDAVDAQLYGFQCNSFVITGNHFENFDGATRGGVTYAACKAVVAWRCMGTVITGNKFINGYFDSDSIYYDPNQRPIRQVEANHAIVIAPGTYGTPGMVSANFFQGCNYGVTISPLDGGIGVYGADVFNQSFAWVTSCDIPYNQTAGFGLPKLNPAYVPDTMQCDTVPNQSNAEGLIYWDTTNRRIMVWDGMAWKTVTLSTP